MEEPQGHLARRGRRVRAADADRDGVLDVLAQAHANGRLDTEEVDDRQSRTLSTKYLSDLPDLIDDLPEGEALSRQFAAQLSPRGPTQAMVHPTSGSGLQPTGGPTNSTAILSGRTFEVAAGTREFKLFALMGGDDVHLAPALGPGIEITVESASIMGGSNIYVPPGVRVVDETVNIMGGNSIRKKAAGDGSGGTVILKGFNLMGGHDIKLDRSIQQR